MAQRPRQGRPARRRRSSGEPEERPTYAVGAVVRATGLSAHVLRAWERRYGAVEPVRTPGGSRRYRESDVRRLQLLRRAVEAGNPISEVARLPDAEIELLLERIAPAEPPTQVPLDAVLDAIERLDAGEAEHLLAVHFGAMGPRAFALRVAIPLLAEIGARWESGRLSIASEHLASALTRNMLGVTLRAKPDGNGRLMLFSTPSGERHELGVLAAASIAIANGARAVYLGPDLPAEEVVASARRLGAGVVVLGVAAARPADVRHYVRRIREELPDDVQIWVGGREAEVLSALPGVDYVESLESLGSRARRFLEAGSGPVPRAGG
jgi:DNA-binding transcriptional MerR regulator